MAQTIDSSNSFLLENIIIFRGVLKGYAEYPFSSKLLLEHSIVAQNVKLSINLRVMQIDDMHEGTVFLCLMVPVHR